MKKARYVIIGILALCLVLLPQSKSYAAGTDSLSDTEKNSSYGFFVWLSENAASEDERKDAETAVQILSDKVSAENSSKVFNQGNIIGGSSGISYGNLLAATEIGAEDDATSLEDIREAIAFIDSGNSYRAKENLSPLKISSALMAMAELNANYQDGGLNHSGVFSALENLAYIQVGGTWQYGTFPGLDDNPYKGWYEDEKANYDSGNGGATGHYETLTDRQGTMLLTGFGVRHRYVDTWNIASDNNKYLCHMHDKYYSQMFSSKSGMYNIGNGMTSDRYLTYLNEYQCTVVGHNYGDWVTTKAASCTEAGSKKATCTVCGNTTTEVIPAAGHTWNREYSTDTPATCITEGSESIHCSVCDAVDETTVRAIPKADHSFGEWKVVQEATENKEGLKERACTVCGKEETEVIEKLPAKEASDDNPSYDPGAGDPGDNPSDNSGAGESVDNPSDRSAADDTGDGPSEIADQPGADPVYQTGKDGTALGEGASAEAADAAIAGMTSDNDLPGALFNKLQLKSNKQTKTSISLSWKKVAGAETYVIYGNRCGKANKMKRLAESTGKTKKFTKILGKKVKKGTYYKFMIVALDKDSKVVSSSKIIHVAAKGGKVGNAGKVTTKAKKNRVSVKKGKTFRLAGKQRAASKKLKVRKHRAVSYESTNPKIASVSKKGVIRGKKKGSCYVYAYAQNGVFAKIKVTVK